MSNLSHNDFDNNFNFSLSPFDFIDRGVSMGMGMADFMDNGLATNQMSTNFYSKILKNADDKI